MSMSAYLNSLPGAVAQGLIWGIMAIGVFITYKILDLADLTVDGSLCTGGAVCAILITVGVNPYLALLISFIAGMFAGAVTGFFHIAFGIPAILSGILTQLMLYSINYDIMGKEANIILSSRTNKYKILLTGSRPYSALEFLGIAGVILIALLYIFFGTEIGCAIRATGSNIAMSRAQSINTNVTKVIGLALSNGVVAFSGALLAQYQGFADLNMGRGAIVTGLAAVVIGGSLFSKLSRNFAVKLLFVGVGSVIYWIVYQTVVFLGIKTDYLKLLAAVVVALFLGVPYVKKEYFPKLKKLFAKKNGGGKDNA